MLLAILSRVEWDAALAIVLNHIQYVVDSIQVVQACIYLWCGALLYFSFSLQAIRFSLYFKHELLKLNGPLFLLLRMIAPIGLVAFFNLTTSSCTFDWIESTVV